MELHSNVKKREVNGTSYFHVHVKSIILGKKIETQRYYFFDKSNDQVMLNKLDLANKKATHLCRRHLQMRAIRDSKISYAEMFFRKGRPKGFFVSKSNRPGRRDYYSIKVQLTTKTGQSKRERTFDMQNINEEESSFQMVFDNQFSYLCKQLKVVEDRFHTQVFKVLIYKTLKENALSL